MVAMVTFLLRGAYLTRRCALAVGVRTVVELRRGRDRGRGRGRGRGGGGSPAGYRHAEYALK